MKAVIPISLIVAILVTACGSTATSSVIAPSAVPTTTATQQSLASIAPAAPTASTTPPLQMTATATRPFTTTPSPTKALSSLPHLLAGTISGLDPGASGNLNLELVQPGDLSQPGSPVRRGLMPPFPDHGTLVARFNVANGPWQATEPALAGGLYILRPEVPGYVSLRTGLVLALPGEAIGFRYSHLDFDFFHPADALERLGVPLCATRPPYGGDIVLPTGPQVTPTAGAPRTGTPLLFATPPLPVGSCYAGYLVPVNIPPAGFFGNVQGLPPGQTATIRIYAVPPAPGETYFSDIPLPPDSNQHLASGQGPLAVVPTLAPGSVLTATLTVGNGPWGLIDPILTAHKYVISIQSSGATLWPKSYETVLYASKGIALESGVDFSVGTPSFSMTPVPTRTPLIIPHPLVEEFTLDQARHIPGFHLFEPTYLPVGLDLLRIVGTLGTTTLIDPTNPSAPPTMQRQDDLAMEFVSRDGSNAYLGIGQRDCVPGVLPPGAVMGPTPDLHPETVKVHNTTATINRYSTSPMGWVTPGPAPQEDIELDWWESDYCFMVSGSLSLDELVKIANSLK